MGASGTQDPTELIVAGTGDVYVADYGTALPAAEATALNAAFIRMGLVSEDGLSFSWTPSVTEFNAWQSRTAVRRELTSQEYNVKFSLEQWNAVNMKAAFGGGSVVVISAGHYRFDFLSDTAALAERSVICDWSDGLRHFRLVLPRVNVTDAAEVKLVRSALAVLPISFKALSPGSGLASAYILTDNEDFWS